MILRINGEVNLYYVQTLCLAFFPGAKFHENEEDSPDVPHVSVTTKRHKNGDVDATVWMSNNGIESTHEEHLQHSTDYTIERLEKIAVGRAMFSCGNEVCGKTSPWGILTGVRPAKVALEMIQSGNGILRSKKILREEYFVNPQKAALAVSIASHEMNIVKNLPKNLCSLYISIPFCPSRCAYCSFVSYTSGKLLSLVDEYLEKLYLDIENMVSIIKDLGLSIATVYVGGGTPTTLNEKQLKEFLEKINSLVDVNSLMEFTLEAGRPDTITKEKLQIAKDLGVTRISVNPQTLSDDVLKIIGRRHTVKEFYDAYELAKNSGIKDINVDLIAGLPGDDFSNFSQSIDNIISLDPSNITVHTFTVKRSADMLRNDSNIYQNIGKDVAKCVSYSQLKNKFAGYIPYYIYRQKNTAGNLENVGYTKEGRECLYNIFMMEEIHSIFACGAGAVTKLVSRKDPLSLDMHIERIFTPKYPYEYLRDADTIRLGNSELGKTSIRDQIFKFYEENHLLKESSN